MASFTHYFINHLSWFLLVGLAPLIWIAFCSGDVNATWQSEVVINEVYPKTVDGNHEWVELFNRGEAPAAIGSWRLEAITLLSSNWHTFPADTLIQPGEYLLVQMSGEAFSDFGDGVQLVNAQGVRIDFMDYIVSHPSVSWARQPDGDGIFTLSTPTPGSTNTPINSATPTPSPSPSAYPRSLVATEIMACPASGNPEWLELFNPDITAYQLDNWRVRDASGNTRVITGEARPQAWSLFSWASGLLNNSGDSLSLETPTGEILWTIPIQQCQVPESWELRDGVWIAQELPTPGEPPTTTHPTPSPSATPIPTASPKPSTQPTPTVTATSIATVGATTSIRNEAQLATSSSILDEDRAPSLSLPVLPFPILGASTSGLSNQHLSTIASQINSSQNHPRHKLSPAPIPWLAIVSVIMGGSLICASCGLALTLKYPWPSTSEDL